MTKEEWESLQIGDKVKVKPFKEISKNLTPHPSTSDILGNEASNITGHYDSFMKAMKKCCGQIFPVVIFWQEEGRQPTALCLGEDEYNFIPEWLEKVVD